MASEDKIQITKEFIEKEANNFFDWPDANNKTFVTFTSCLLFAEHIAKIVVEEKKE